MNTKAPAQVAARLKALRVGAGLTQETLAKAAGIDRKTINRIENGHFSPHLDTFFRICYALNVRPVDIVGGIKV